MTLKAFIVDDEVLARDTLAALLNKFCPGVTVTGTADSFASAVKKISEQEIDTLFMDINLGEKSGFDVLDQLLSYSFTVVFVTAYEEFALKAFSYRAVNYLLKPVSHTDLVDTVNRISKAVTPAGITKDKGIPGKIALPDKDKLELVAIDEISHLEAKGSYTIVYLLEGRNIIVSKNLKQFEEMEGISHHFIRVHKSFMVHSHFIKAFNKADNGYLELQNGESIPIGNLYRQKVMQLFNR